jgi:multidrug efflux system membrane fusion protein
MGKVRMMRWGIWVVLVLLLAGLGGLFYFNRIQWGGPPSGPMPIYAAKIEQVQFYPKLTLTGRMQSASAAEIRPTFTGIIEKIHFIEGQNVRVGDPLFTVDLRAYNSQARQAAAQYQQAEAAYQRGLKLREMDAISQADLEARRAARQAAAAVSVEAGVSGDRAVIRAPIAGRVGRAEALVGELVSRESGLVLTTVQNTQTLYVDFDLPEQTVLAFPRADDLKNMNVNVGLANDNNHHYPYEAKLLGLDNRLGVENGALRVRAALNNADGDLLPGMFVRIQLELPTEQTGLVVNDAAIGTEQTLRFVYKIGMNNQPERVAVQVGELVNGLRVISPVERDSLKVGDYVVVNGLMRIRPGFETLPFPADMKTGQPISGSAPLTLKTTAAPAK